jgi:Xaa-Pro aminopeptidase
VARVGPFHRRSTQGVRLRARGTEGHHRRDQTRRRPIHVQKIAEEVYTRRGFDPRNAYIGHYVGMSVHDVGDWSAPFEEGMVLAIEPILDLPDKHLHIRIEDTLLVTRSGAEVLTGAVPKEASEVLQLLPEGK